MLYREIIAVCSQIHTKHINTPCGHNVELLNVKLPLYKVIARNFVLHVPLLKNILYFYVQTNKCTSISMFCHRLSFINMFRPPLSPSSMCPILKIKFSPKRILSYIFVQLFVQWLYTVMKVWRVTETCSWRLTNVTGRASVGLPYKCNHWDFNSQVYFLIN
jgi:hypothetical protein